MAGREPPSPLDKQPATKSTRSDAALAKLSTERSFGLSPQSAFSGQNLPNKGEVLRRI